MANIGKLPSAQSVWADSTAASRLTLRPYGKSGLHLDMETDPQSGKFRTLMLKHLTDVLATYDWVGTITVAPTYLNPAVLPYVNDFIGDGGNVIRDWRAAKAKVSAPDRRYRLAADGTSYRKATDWSLAPVSGAAQAVPGTAAAALAANAAAGAPKPKAGLAAKVDAAKAAAAQQSGTVIHTGAQSGIATHQAPGSGVTTATFTSSPLGTVLAPTDVSDENHGRDSLAAVETAVESPLPTFDAQGTLVLPEGWVGIERNGETLAIPEAVIGEFTAAVKARRATAKPHFVLFVGPTGGGKTEGAIAMAEREGYTVRVIDCAPFETASDVFGSVEPDDTTGQWVRKPSTFWLALEEAAKDEDQQFCIILDELTRAKVAAANAFIAPMHNSATLTNSVTGAKVVVGPNVVIVATANIGAAYSGTEVLDAALRSRFAVTLNIAYLPREIEALIVESVGLPKADAELVARLAESLRAVNHNQPFRSALVPGTRDIVQVARQAMFSPNGVKGAWTVCVIERFSDEGKEATKTERARASFASSLVFAPSIDANATEGVVS